MNTPPYYHMAVSVDNGVYYAAEHRASAVLQPQQFDSFESLVWYVKKYGGLVVAPPEIWQQLQVEGILLVRNAT